MAPNSSNVGRSGQSDSDDWSYLNYPRDERSDYRWASVPAVLLRNVVRWITGRDPVEERRRAELAREQAESAARFNDAESDAYRHLGRPKTDPSTN